MRAAARGSAWRASPAARTPGCGWPPSAPRGPPPPHQGCAPHTCPTSDQDIRSAPPCFEHQQRGRGSARTGRAGMSKTCSATAFLSKKMTATGCGPKYRVQFFSTQCKPHRSTAAPPQLRFSSAKGSCCATPREQQPAHVRTRRLTCHSWHACRAACPARGSRSPAPARARSTTMYAPRTVFAPNAQPSRSERAMSASIRAAASFR